MTDPVRAVDFIARLAEAWDGRGRNALRPPSEHLALLQLAGLPHDLSERAWSELTEQSRRGLIFAARRAVELGRACAWVFGEGRGA